MSAPRVTVVIPCYNSAQFITETLESVFQQTYTDHEIFVVNDCSPDTPEFERILQPYRDRIEYRIAAKNAGPSAARNIAIREARGEFIALLDSDDIWLPNYLEVQIGLLDTNPDADVVYGNAVVFGNHPTAGRDLMSMAPSHGEVTFESLATERCCPTISALIRKSVFDRLGLFDERWRRSEDFEMWLRCVIHGSRIIYHREILFRYRRHGNNFSGDAVSMRTAAAEVLSDKLAEGNLNEHDKKVARENIARMTGAALYFEGKKAFLAGDYKTAVFKLREANIRLKSPKISLMTFLLRTAPGLARYAHALRSGPAL